MVVDDALIPGEAGRPDRGLHATAIHMVSHCPSVSVDGSTYCPVLTSSNNAVSLSSAFFRVPWNVCHFCLRRSFPVSGPARTRGPGLRA